MLAHDNDAVQPSRIYIVEEGPNPSTDYFVLPLVTRTHATVLRCSWDQLPAADDLHGASVIFIRYVTAEWRALIEQTRHSLARLIYFMDDDLFDWKAAQGLTWRYRFKLLKRATWQRKWLLKMQSELWVSTPWLQQKYASLKPCLVRPTPLSPANYCNKLPNHADSSSVEIRQFDEFLAKNCKVSEYDAHDANLSASTHSSSPAPLTPLSQSHSTNRGEATDQTEDCVVFYHGTGSHQAEIEWLLPVIEQVLAVNNNIRFEIIGNAKTQNFYGHLKRVTVIPQMKWPAYQDFIKQPGRHIGLAPMLDHPFNQARSYTKFFDIHRTGAAGIYAEKGPWQAFIEPGKQGVLVPMQVASWVSAILDLAAAQAQRARILRAASDTIHELLYEAQNQNFEGMAEQQTDVVSAQFETFEPRAHRQSAAVNALRQTDELAESSQSIKHNKHPSQRNAH
jgi:hypothetical protein